MYNTNMQSFQETSYVRSFIIHTKDAKVYTIFVADLNETRNAGLILEKLFKGKGVNVITSLY